MIDWELVYSLAKKHKILLGSPDASSEDIHWAIEQTVLHLKDYPGERRRYATLAKHAAELIDHWLSRGASYTVDIDDIDSVLGFIRSHAPSCAWCVLKAKAYEKKYGVKL